MSILGLLIFFNCTLLILAFNSKPNINTNELTNEIAIKKEQYIYYEVEAIKCEPGNYGIQIASYTDSGSLLKSISDFKLKHDLPLHVQESESINGRIYRLIAGHFNTKDEAEIIIDKLKTDYSDCFILNLNK